MLYIATLIVLTAWGMPVAKYESDNALTKEACETMVRINTAVLEKHYAELNTTIQVEGSCEPVGNPA